jgi:acetyl esterase/lipase
VYDSRARLERFLGGTPRTAAEAYRLASITERVRAGVPRTLLLHGGRDQLVSPTNALLLATKLAGASVAHDLVVVPYGQHCFDYVVGGLSGQIAEAVVLRFLAGTPKRL